MDEGYTQQRPKFCSMCGAPVYEGQIFCQNCGNKLVQPSQTLEQTHIEETNLNFEQPQVEDTEHMWARPLEQSQMEEMGQPLKQPQMEEMGQVLGQPQMAEMGQPQVQPQMNEPQQTMQYNETPQSDITNTSQGQGQQYYYGQAYGQQNYGYEQQAFNGQSMMPPNGPGLVANNAKQPMDPKKKKKMIILFSSLGAGFLALIAVGIFLLYYFSFTRIDASKIYKVTYEGVNGKAEASFRLDDESKELSDVIEDAKKDLNLQKIYLLNDIEFLPDRYEDLSNGDIIKVTVDYDEEDFNDYKLKLTNTTFEVKVEGLQDADEYDLFKDIEITYEGTSGYGIADIDTSNCDSFVNTYVRYSIKDDPSNLKNGDTITVLASVDEEDLSDNGYTTDVFEKEYTVEGLQELQTYDAFKDIVLVFEGASPNLKVSVDTNGCEADIRDNVTFYIDDNENKKNGDTVTVYIDFNQDYMRSLGYDITEKSKDFVIENQAELLSVLNKEDASKLDAVTKELVDTWVKANGEGYVYEVSLEDEIGAGYTLSEAANTVTSRYFGTKVDGDPYNTYAIIYKCSYTAINKDNNDKKTKDLYVLVTLDNVCLEADKTYSYVVPETYLYSNDINKLIDALNDSGYSFNEVKVTD